MSECKFLYNKPFELEGGGVLPQVEIVYHTYGKLSAAQDNIIWICHALTANSAVDDWWPHTIEKGKFLDPEKYFVICPNFLGSCYGTTGPMSVNPESGEPYYDNFPLLTIRDLIKAHQLLAEHLGIKSVKALMGSSIGGFQVAEWLIIEPGFAQKAVLIATAAEALPWVVAFNESQRMAIECDASYGEKRVDAGAKGLATARSIAMLSYRGQHAYDLTQRESDERSVIDGCRASSYQRYQGEKLVKRFDAYTYYYLTKLIDTHNVGRGRGGVEQALSVIESDVAIIAISSDIIYPVSSNEVFSRYIKNAKMYTIESSFGHDGFLVEHEKLDEIIRAHLDK
ncbi:MAG: homoserine O-acetyltransferase [Rikenellaceae bacterium]